MRIRSGFYYLTADQFQCESKVERFYDMGVTRKKLTPDKAMEEAEMMVETQNHCNSITSTPMYEIDGYAFSTCVCNFIHNELNFFLTLFHEFDKHGTLPFPGSLGDQPNFIIEVLNLLKSMKLEKEAEDHKQAEKQNRSKR